MKKWLKILFKKLNYKKEIIDLQSKIEILNFRNNYYKNIIDTTNDFYNVDLNKEDAIRKLSYLKTSLDVCFNKFTEKHNDALDNEQILDYVQEIDILRRACRYNIDYVLSPEFTEDLQKERELESKSNTP